MTILDLILALLKLTNMVFSWAQQNQWIKVGEDRAVAEAARSLFLRTEHAREIDANIKKLSEAEVDELLLKLGEPVSVSDDSTSKSTKG